MKTLFIFCTLFLSVASGLFAQSEKYKFSSAIQVGMLGGESGPALQLQTTNGLRHKTWSAGIGVGLDYYHTRSIPLFLDVRKTIGNKTKAPFIYVDGGYNFPWLSEKNKKTFITDAQGGLYYDAGVGYQIPVLKGRSLFFSAGYAVKHISTIEKTWIFIDYIWPGPASPPDNQYKYDYTLGRISIKTGLRF